MASSHFVELEAQLLALKAIYLDSALVSFSPTIEQQEMARAFQAFSHAEIEWFVERICIDLSDRVLREATARKFSASTLSLLTFASLDPLSGGESLGGAKGARSMQSRVGDAVAKHKALAEANEGIREKHLAKMFVPLGLTANDVDVAWLADLDSFCSVRGAIAHMSRSQGRASHLAVNPSDVWQLCQRLVWSATPGSPRIASFQELDAWVAGMSSVFANPLLIARPQPWWRRVLAFFTTLTVRKKPA